MVASRVTTVPGEHVEMVDVGTILQFARSGFVVDDDIRAVFEHVHQISRLLVLLSVDCTFCWQQRVVTWHVHGELCWRLPSVYPGVAYQLLVAPCLVVKCFSFGVHFCMRALCLHRDRYFLFL